MEIWAEYANLHPCFEVRQKVDVPHLFTRDELDVIYVDHMAWFVKVAAGVGVSLCRKRHTTVLRLELLYRSTVESARQGTRPLNGH